MSSLNQKSCDNGKETFLEKFLLSHYEEGMSYQNFLNELQGSFCECPKGEDSIEYILKNLYTLKREKKINVNERISPQQMTEMLDALANDALMDLQDQANADICGKNGEIRLPNSSRSFLHRFPKNRHKNGWSTNVDRTTGRFTVNAEMNPNMIQELDEFCSKHKCCYKTSYPKGWEERVDPVNMYIHEPVTDSLKQDFVKIMEKYIRSKSPECNDLLDGEVLLPGITFSKEYTPPEDAKWISSLPKRIKEAVCFKVYGPAGKEFIAALEKHDEVAMSDAFDRIRMWNRGEKEIPVLTTGQRAVVEEFTKFSKQHFPQELNTEINPIFLKGSRSI